MTDREEHEMSRKPSSSTKTNAARERHSTNVKASDARKREMGLVRIAVWVPHDQTEAFKRDAKRAVDQYLKPVSTDRDQRTIPTQWRDPKPLHDRRHASLPF
jgi:vacuolar-type H+-ATPase subunit I/STV1